MVQQKKQFSEDTNGTSKRDQSDMSYRGKDMGNARSMGNRNNDTKNQNGARNFRTDTAISNNRNAGERVLKPWVPDADSATHGALEGGLEGNSSGAKWDQFKVNQEKFGIGSTFDELHYTTAINKNAPNYNRSKNFADKVAREIEGTTPTWAHVAEERSMDYVGGKGQEADEEDKYSGVRRTDQNESLSSGLQGRYMPPARRAPTGQATVAGAPVDPAIISAQVKGSQPKKPSPPKPQAAKVAVPSTSSPKPQPTATNTQAKENKPAVKPVEAKDAAPEASASEQKPADKPADKPAASSSRPSAVTTKLPGSSKETDAKSATTANAANAPSAASTVEHDVLKAFKGFAGQQRVQDQQRRTNKIKQDTHVKLQELKKFAEGFKLSTPVPRDLISIIAKDPAKQKQIQQKALDDIHELAKTKDTPAKPETTPAPKEGPAKAVEPTPAPATTPATSAEPRNNARPAAPQHTPSPQGMQNRQPGRQPYAQQGYHQYQRNDRSSHVPRGGQQTGHLGERLRQNQMNNRAGPPHFNQDMRGGMPPTGPANSVDPNYNRRLSAMPQGHLGPKLNPTSHEFRPNAFAAPFNPNGPSTGSSPRSAINNVVVEPAPAPAPQSGQVIRRKTKAIDVKKCSILSNLKKQQPPQGRSWEENNGLRPSWDTLPTWRQPKDDEKDSTMQMTYKEFFEKMPYMGASMATPNPQHVYPQQMPHQHQLPLSMQHSSHGAPRQSPHMAPMQMHPSAHGHVQQGPFGHADDHRMMHSNSAQSYASPRISQVPMYPPNMNAPNQMPYGQPVMGQFMPTTPQMNQFRNFSNSPQYMPQQGGPIAMQMMPPGQFVAGQNPMMQGGPQMPMYPGGPQFVAPAGGAPPQGMPVSTGYPSPGRPAAAPMMIQQGSQQGQPGGYGVSPGIPFQQPFNPQQHPGHMPGRGYSNGNPQQYGTSPQQVHPYPRERNGSNNYAGKGYQGHNQHQPQHNNNAAPSGPQGRTPDGPEEAK